MLITILRTLLIYFIIIFAMRLMGKKQLGELQPSELVSTILISNLASISIESTELPMLNSIVPVLLIVCLEILISSLGVRFHSFSTLITGRPKVIIRDGVIDQGILKELRFTVDDLLEALRGKEVFSLEEVKFAVVETNGTINLYRTSSASPVTRGDMKIDTAAQKPRIPVILSGEVNASALHYCEKDEKWLDKVLKKENTSPREVLVLLCDDTQKYELIKKEKSGKAAL